MPRKGKVVYHISKEESSSVAALSSGRVDIMEALRWQLVDQLKRTAPELKFRKHVATQGTYIALKTDQKPFDDVRVRRAMHRPRAQLASLSSLLNGCPLYTPHSADEPLDAESGDRRPTATNHRCRQCTR